MAIDAITDNLPSAAVMEVSNRAQRLRALLSSAGHNSKLSNQDVKDAAALLVSEMGFKPMLAEMRKSPFQSELFGGGRTEAIFGEQLDERLADIVAQGSGAGISARISDLLRASLHEDEANELAPPDEPPTHDGLEVIA